MTSTEYKRRWYEKHKENALKYQKEYYEKHKKERSEKARKYYQEHKEEIKLRAMKYHTEHKVKKVYTEKDRAYHKAYYQKHKARISELMRNRYRIKLGLETRKVKND